MNDMTMPPVCPGPQDQPMPTQDQINQAVASLGSSTSKPSASADCSKTFKSTYALDQLTLIAKTTHPKEFIRMMSLVFGGDIPAAVYHKLQDALCAGNIKNPEYILAVGGDGRYDKIDRVIWIGTTIIDDATNGKDPDASWQLLSILLHEFGHHIDNVLRRDLAADFPNLQFAKKATHEKGVKFAYRLALLDIEHDQETEYAHYRSLKYDGPLKVNHAEARAAILMTQKVGDFVESYTMRYENFVAGEGEAGGDGHQSIEEEAFEGIFNSREIRQIYFGNWLRDNSQVLSPATVLPNDKKNLGLGFSRTTWTKIVDVLSIPEFYELRRMDRKSYKLTPEMLGVYRSDEHIDNPVINTPPIIRPRIVDPDIAFYVPSLSDNKPPLLPKEIDQDFEDYVTPKQLEFNMEKSRRNYIDDAVKYMRKEIDLAITCGKTPEGMRHFGAGLHVLEDYYAHSNFVELSLQRVGYTNVLPWTAERLHHDRSGSDRYPVVTGKFAGSDTVASLIPVLEEIFFSPEKKQHNPNTPSKAAAISLIILEERAGESKFFALMLNILKFILRPDDTNAANERALNRLLNFFSLLFKPLKKIVTNPIIELTKYIGRTILLLLVNSIPDIQNKTGDPNRNPKVDPSHSQLAKDHATHPFHDLAVKLATHAVRDVGLQMSRCWKNTDFRNPADVAEAFICHPDDTVGHWQDAVVREWAKKHPSEVQQGSDRSALRRLRDDLLKDAKETLERILTENNGFLIHNESFACLYGEQLLEYFDPIELFGQDDSIIA
jgi:hypothetical protein